MRMKENYVVFYKKISITNPILVKQWNGYPINVNFTKYQYI